MMKLKFRTVFWIGAAAVVAVLLVLAFRPQPVPVDVAATSRGPMLVTVRDEGRTRVRDEYIVSSPIAGRLLRVDLEPGDRVHAGDPLATILPGPPAFLDARTAAEAQAAIDAAAAALEAARTEHRRAEAQLDFAQAELARVENLTARDLASADALDRARLELRNAEAGFAAAAQAVRGREAELEAARSRLVQPSGADESEERVIVRAPVDGYVLRVVQESESIVGGGAQIMSLGDPNRLEIVVEMLSTDAVEVERGAQVIIENFARGGATLQGRVRLIEPFGFTKVSALGVEEQRVNVIVDFSDPPESRPRLAHGYRVEAAVVTWSADDVLRVPVAALFRSGGRWAVFRVEAGAARAVFVEVGRNNGQFAEVLSGIGADETVVLYPGERVADGVRVVERD